MPRIQFAVQSSRRSEVLDITDEVSAKVAAMGVEQGLVCVSVAHCTCALYVNENESGLVADTLRLIEEMSQRNDWRHDRIDDNAAAHLAASIIGSSVVLPVNGGRVELGTWQRIMLLELDGPRRRRVTVQVVADGS